MVSYGNPLNAFSQGYNQSQNMFDQFTRKRAGAAMASGDTTGGMNAFYKGGMIDEGRKVQADIYGKEDRAKDSKKEEWEFYREAATMLKRVATERGPEELAQAYDSLAPVFARMPGSNPQTVQQMRQQVLQNPAILDAIVEAANKELQFIKTDQGIYVGDKSTGKVDLAPGTAPKPGSKGSWKERRLPNGGTELVWVPDGPPSASTPSSGPATSSTPNVEDVWAAAIQQESSGQPGVLGPQTQYGQAQGMTQMLPGTAREMAQKLGVPWRPELMTGTSPEAAQYQQQLGRAYFDEGLQKYGGDPVKALMYYHGGPDEAKWGPKTRAHAEAVMRRVQPYQVASAGQTPGPPSQAAPTAGGASIPWDAPESPDSLEALKRENLQAQVDERKKKADNENRRARAAVSNVKRAAATVVRDGREALRLMDETPTFAIGGPAGSASRWALRGMPGSGEFEVTQLIESMKSNIGIDTLLNIKREGSGLGQVPQQQLITLQSVLGLLDIRRDPKLLRRDLEHAVELYEEIVRVAQEDFEAFEGADPDGSPAGAQPGRRLTPEEAAKLPSGTRFIGTDGVERVRQ